MKLVPEIVVSNKLPSICFNLLIVTNRKVYKTLIFRFGMTKTVTQYKAYGGRNVGQMPLMLAQGVVPLPASEFMSNREAIIGQFGDIYADTSDLVAYGGKRASDEIRLIMTVDNQGRITDSGRKALELISPAQERSSGAIVLSDELYDGFNGANVVTLSRKDLKKYGVDKNLTKAQVLNHSGWRVLLRHPDAVPAEFAYDKGFMQEVVGKTFAEMNKRHSYTEGMGFYPDASEKNAKLRAWVVYGLESRSVADGRRNLDSGRGRFVGIAPEAPNASIEVASGETLYKNNQRTGSFADEFPDKSQTVKPYTTADLHAFDEAMNGLEAIVRSDVLKPFISLRKKL